MAIAIAIPALVAPPIIWWLFSSGTDSHVAYDTLIREIDAHGVFAAVNNADVMAQTALECFRLLTTAFVLLAPAPIIVFLVFANLWLFASIRDGDSLIVVVMPHASACLLFPTFVSIASVPVAIAARHVWPSPRQSAGAELLIFVLLLSFLAANIGFAASCVIGSLEFRRRHKVSS